MKKKKQKNVIESILRAEFETTALASSDYTKEEKEVNYKVWKKLKLAKKI